jgi:hypothetical protein
MNLFISGLLLRTASEVSITGPGIHARFVAFGSRDVRAVGLKAATANGAGYVRVRAVWVI